MHLTGIAIFILIFPAIVSADWTLRQADDGQWISTRNAQGHQLIIAHNQAEETQFLLVLAVADPVPPLPGQVAVAVGRGPVSRAGLSLLEQRPDSRLFRIELAEQDKDIFISRMIAGLTFHLWFGEPVRSKSSLDFSLLGFTAAFNDLLIADRIGRLDPAWLIEQHRLRELGCYYTANLFVAAMQARIAGRSAEQTLAALPRSGLASVDEVIPDIVRQVYSVPHSRLPIDPRGDKFAIFDECMGH